MAVAETILTYVFTFISVFVTIKGVKTAFIEILRFLTWLIAKLKQTYYLLFPSKEPYTSATTLRRLIERSKSTLMPFISRDYYQKMKRKQLVGVVYLFSFIFGLFLIITFFWAFLQADLSIVLENSPYLIQPIENFLINYQSISLTISAFFIIGFLIEVINSIRSLSPTSSPV